MWASTSHVQFGYIISGFHALLGAGWRPKKKKASGSISHSGTRIPTTVALERRVRGGAVSQQVSQGLGWGIKATVLVPFVTQMLLKMVPGTVTAKCPMGGEG